MSVEHRLRRPLRIAALVAVGLALAASGCGRYGPPQRAAERPPAAAPAPSQPPPQTPEPSETQEPPS
jgi:hypothetical protein